MEGDGTRFATKGVAAAKLRIGCIEKVIAMPPPGKACATTEHFRPQPLRSFARTQGARTSQLVYGPKRGSEKVAPADGTFSLPPQHVDGFG
jgi:hypothetical protein